MQAFFARLSLHFEDTAQPKRIAEHRDRGKAHGERGDHGREQRTAKCVQQSGRDRDADGVVEESPEQIWRRIRMVLRLFVIST